MLTIREEQFRALELAQEDRFITRLMDFLRQRFPDSLEMPPDMLMAEMRRQFEKAQYYQIVTEQGVATYVITAWLLGVDFDNEFPAAQEILSSNVTPEYKQHWLAEWTAGIFRTFDQDRG